MITVQHILYFLHLVLYPVVSTSAGLRLARGWSASATRSIARVRGWVAIFAFLRLLEKGEGS